MSSGPSGSAFAGIAAAVLAGIAAIITALPPLVRSLASFVTVWRKPRPGDDARIAAAVQAELDRRKGTGHAK